MKKLASAVAYMHDHGMNPTPYSCSRIVWTFLSDMVHRDLKLENILLSSHADDALNIKVGVQTSEFKSWCQWELVVFGLRLQTLACRMWRVGQDLMLQWCRVSVEHHFTWVSISMRSDLIIHIALCVVSFSFVSSRSPGKPWLQPAMWRVEHGCDHVYTVS